MKWGVRKDRYEPSVHGGYVFLAPRTAKEQRAFEERKAEKIAEMNRRYEADQKRMIEGRRKFFEKLEAENAAKFAQSRRVRKGLEWLEDISFEPIDEWDNFDSDWDYNDWD